MPQSKDIISARRRTVEGRREFILLINRATEKGFTPFVHNIALPVNKARHIPIRGIAAHQRLRRKRDAFGNISIREVGNLHRTKLFAH